MMRTMRAAADAALFGSLMTLLAACVPAANSGADAGLEEKVQAAAEAGPPAGAIPISDTSYAVPVAVDADGCEQFSEWSTEGVARQVVYFHDGSGGFTAVKSAEHACKAEMVAVGEDDRGCTLYRAEQPDGQSTDVDYYRTAIGYTANPAIAECAG